MYIFNLLWPLNSRIVDEMNKSDLFYTYNLFGMAAAIKNLDNLINDIVDIGGTDFGCCYSFGKFTQLWIH